VREQRTASKQERAGIHVFPNMDTLSALIATASVSMSGTHGVSGVRVSAAAVLSVCQSEQRTNERTIEGRKDTDTHSPTHSEMQSLTRPLSVPTNQSRQPTHDS